MKLLIPFSFCLFFALISCNKEVEVILPDTPPKVVVIGFISPFDSIISVKVNLSRPIFNKNTASYVPDEKVWASKAIVSISDDIQHVVLKYDSIAQHFATDSTLLKLVAGGTYYLNVTTPEGNKITASCTVPKTSNHTPTVKVIPKKTVSGYYDTFYSAIIQWKDNSDTKDYFLIHGIAKNDLTSEIEYLYPYYSIKADDERKGDLFYLNQEFSQQKIDKADDWSFYLYILSLDEHYYNYYWSRRISSEGTPFAEQSNIYTNIIGGLGVFGAYSVSTYEFGLEELL